MRVRLSVALLSTALSLATGACDGVIDPGLTSRDHAFEDRLDKALSARGPGRLSQEEVRVLLDSLFETPVAQVCIISGGDWVEGVRAQWSRAPSMPTSVDKLLDAGSGDISLDGLVAVVGVNDQGQGYVRRGNLGSADCDYQSPICWHVNSLKAEVVDGRLYDAGPLAGTQGRALRLSDGQRSATCALEPFPE